MQIAIANPSALETIAQWVNSVALNPEIQNLDAWVIEAEDVANNAMENEDIVIEMRGFATNSGRPETLTLKRNEFTWESEFIKRK